MNMLYESGLRYPIGTERSQGKGRGGSTKLQGAHELLPYEDAECECGARFGWRTCASEGVLRFFAPMFTATSAWRVGLRGPPEPRAPPLFPPEHPIHLLHHTKLDALIPSGQKLICVPLGSTIEHLLGVLHHADIVSAPVIDPKTQAFVGFVELLDVVALLNSLGGEARARIGSSFLSTPVDAAMNLSGVLVPALDGVPRHPILSLSASATVAELFECMAHTNDVHRIVVTAPHASERVVGIISQRDVLKWYATAERRKLFLTLP